MKILKTIRSWGKYLGSERGAFSLGGAVAPAAIPLAIDANNPNIRRFNVTYLDADTGPTAFNHGVLVPAGQTPIAFPIQQVPLTAAQAPGLAVTATQTQVTLSKTNVTAGSGGAVPGTTVVYILVVWNLHSIIM